MRSPLYWSRLCRVETRRCKQVTVNTTYCVPFSEQHSTSAGNLWTNQGIKKEILLRLNKFVFFPAIALLLYYVTFLYIPIFRYLYHSCVMLYFFISAFSVIALLLYYVKFLYISEVSDRVDSTFICILTCDTKELQSYYPLAVMVLKCFQKISDQK